MEGAESPLEVLSRAATMVQENQQNSMTTSEDNKQSSNKQLPTTKWKRERRCRLPEYSRKSDPKIPEVFNMIGTDQTTNPLPSSAESQNSSPINVSPPAASLTSSFQRNGGGISPPTTPTNTPIITTPPLPQENGGANRTGGAPEYPLDMSVRQRGLPPSYSQTVNNPSYRSSYRRTVIQNPRDELPSGISMCDPIIDEHFRRSLGEDYVTLFSNNNVPKEPPRVKTPPKATTSVVELMDPTGLSVDDHFAKALGDTWLKLNKKENEIKNTTSDNHSMVSI